MVDSRMGGGGGGGGGVGVGIGGNGSLGGQQYCLKWNNHQNNMLRVFTRLLGQEQFTDCVLAAEGNKIKCHKLVLSACSSYFEHLFMNFADPGIQIVILKDTSYADIAAIIDFMYKGEINVSQDKLSSLLKTAENLKVKGLAEVSGESEKKTPAVSSPVVNPAVTPRVGPAVNRLGGPPPMQMMGRPGMNGGGTGGTLLGSIGETGNNNFFGAMQNGELKRKRGRPRTLDGPEDDNSCFTPRISGVTGCLSTPSSLPTPSLTYRPDTIPPPLPTTSKLGCQPVSSPGMSPLQAALSKPLETGQTTANSSPSVSGPSSPTPRSTPTPGCGSVVKLEPGTENSSSRCNTPSFSISSSVGSTFTPTLTPEQVASWGIIKMNDYLISGTRQQYWEEYFVKHVMAAVKNKEIDMKGAAELLGVSYGTLYGRYRETFGYLKHAWNVSGRPQKKTSLWSDPNTQQILESMRSGSINIKQAAEALGMEPAMLAYQLAGKMSSGDKSDIGEDSNGLGAIGMDDIEMVGEYGDDEDEDGEDIYREELMEVQPDIIMEPDHEPEQFDSIVEEVDPILSIQDGTEDS